MLENRRKGILLFLAGVGLLFSQYIAARELGSTFFPTELSILAATIITVLGPSVGYALSWQRAICARHVQAFTFVAMLCQLLLPFSIRTLVALCGRSNPAVAFLLITSQIFILCGYYSFLLPHISALSKIPLFYAIELSGSVTALLVLLLIPSHKTVLVGCFLLPTLFGFLLLKNHLWVVLSVLGILFFCCIEPLDRAIAEQYFARYRGVAAPHIVASTYSPYQRIDVVHSAGEKTLFLDGVPFYRKGDLDQFTHLLAKLPGLLAKPQGGNALVIGSGSFSSAAHLHRLGYHVLVIELDQVVAELGFHHFAKIHGLSHGDVTIQIADARSVLPTLTQRFDRIVLDVPAPYRIHTALLHSPSFYAQIAELLSPNGIVSLSLCSRLQNPLGRQIAASAARVFPQVFVIETESIGMGILFASKGFPFTVSELSATLHSIDPSTAFVLPDRSVRRETFEVPPLSEQNFLGVFWLARQFL